MGTEELRQLIKNAAAAATEGFDDPDARERYLDYYDDSVVLHGYPPGVEDKNGARTFYTGLWEGLEGGRVDIHEVLVEGDTVAVRYQLTGTHAGELMGVPPSGNAVEVSGQSLIRVRDGKFVERFQSFDTFTLLHQIGAIPAPA